MAIIDKKGRLHGRVGNLVYRVLKNGTEVISSRPKRMKQTRATKESGLEFGLASSSASYVRQAFLGLTHHADAGMINRLNGAVLRSIKGSKTRSRGERDLHDGDLSELTGFQFNLNSPVDQVLPVRPLCTLSNDKHIKVCIPSFNDVDLKRPVNGHCCAIQLTLVAFNYKEGYFETLAHTEFPILWNKNIMQSFDWQPEIQVPAGCIAMVSLSLNYSCSSSISGSYVALNNTKFNPAEIIAAYSIPAEPTDLPHKKGENNWLMSSYKGADLLKSIEKLRLKDPKYKKKIDGQKEAVQENLKNADLTIGRIYFKKPGAKD